MTETRISIYLPVLFLALSLTSCKQSKHIDRSLIRFERERVLVLADSLFDEAALTITAYPCERSSGSPNEFYSEGDYWWPDPSDPEAPYIRKDGMSNPENFTAHRTALMRFSRITGAMTSAWLLTGKQEYAQKAMEQMVAWFVTDSTCMAPNMNYAQAIKGRYTGRGIGIIDALPLAEIARCAFLLENAPDNDPEQLRLIREWFSSFLFWMTHHPYGLQEMVHPNNHGTCWAFQAASYAGLTGNDSLLTLCDERFRKVILPEQMAEDGSFPLELERTKPYSYSLFNLDALSLLAQTLKIYTDDDPWSFVTSDGRSLDLGMQFIFPYIQDKGKWPYPEDVMYGNSWPVSQPALIFAALAFDNGDYFRAWKELEHDPSAYELQRNLVIRYPVLWLDKYGKRNN